MQFPSSPHKLSKKILVNNQIRAREVRVISEEGKQLGILPIQEALKIAKERGLDLVQVTDRVSPPVCKILNYGKLIYEESKKKRKQKKTGELKAIRISFNISSHDLETKINQAKKFLEKGSKIRIEMRLRGREKSLGKIANQRMEEIVEKIKEYIPIKLEREIKKERSGLTIIISKE